MHGTSPNSTRSHVNTNHSDTEDDDENKSIDLDDNTRSKAASSLDIRWAAWQRLVPRIALFVITGMISFYTLMRIAHSVLNIDLPHTLKDVQLIAVNLDTMTHTGTWKDYFAVAFVFAAIYLWQQGFSMPGSVLLNLLSGHLYGVVAGTLWTSYLTALGSTLAYLFGWMVGTPAMEMSWVKRRADAMRDQMEKEGTSTGLFWWLLFARLFPFSPYWFINLASPLLGIPVMPFFWSTFLGSMPYNYVCAQAGEVLGELTSTSDILTVSLMMKLLLVSLVSLIPVIWGKPIQAKLRGWLQQKQQNDDEELELESHQTSLGYIPVSTHIN